MTEPSLPDEGRITTEPCLVHTKHTPASHLNERHHVWPLGDGGPRSGDNLVVICPTGHSNVHSLLRLYRVHRGQPPYSELRTFAFGEREITRLGWDQITRRAM